jgi:hypothetical protein
MVVDRKTKAPDADAAQRIMEQASAASVHQMRRARNVVRFLAVGHGRVDIRDALGILTTLKAALA